MSLRFARQFGVLTLTSVLSLPAWSQGQQPATGGAQAGQTAPAQGDQQQAAAPGGKQVKDRAEYDLIEGIRTATDNNKKVELLNQWKEKYPDSAFKVERLQTYLATYQAMQDRAKIRSTAREVLQQDPNNFLALLALTQLTVQENPAPGPDLDEGEKAANGMLQNLDATFAADKKPAQVPADAWTRERQNYEILGHQSLALIAGKRNQTDQVEKEYGKLLQLNPGNAALSYQWGRMIIADQNKAKQTERIPVALYHIARAVAYQGQGALPAGDAPKVRQYLERAYTQYHGSKDGLDQMIQQASAQPLPPPGFQIRSAVDIAKEDIEKQNQLAKDNPSLALWMNLRDQLKANPAYFKDGLEGKALPDLTGTLVSAQPETRPTTLVLAMSDAATPEVTLKLDGPLPGNAPAGTKLTFKQAVGESFTPEPFMLTFKADNAGIAGWPGKAAPAARPAARRPAARRR